MTVGALTLIILSIAALVFFGGGWAVKRLLGWNDPGDLGLAGVIALCGTVMLIAVVGVLVGLFDRWNEVIG